MAFFTYSAEDQNIRSELVLIFFGNFFQQNNRLIYRSEFDSCLKYFDGILLDYSTLVYGQTLYRYSLM